MKIPYAVARFNKKVTNPIQRQWAPRLAPWAMVEHVGRKSGTRYSIPVLAWVEGKRLSIVLTYGPDTDWVKNVQAAGRFEVIRKGKKITVVGPVVVPSDSPDIAKGAKIPARGFDYVLNGTILAGER
ncbi:MAG: nitroreductase family deazaflavin-dependent oxidoreductase [Gordonia sp. (in: high G+C Gram-positive bacteria)]|uniref:nitroreductase family deazaflavin-dependent oxidoreductase n=1 Tax=Gordonia sp. (in: high G+C Gram-positive bacteria) TaxID=84139 RepID=UPI0039E26594